MIKPGKNRKTCKAVGCDNFIFGKGYCKSHQYMRDDVDVTDRSKKKPRQRIKYSSKKRIDENELYKEAKMIVRSELLESGQWKCFFSNEDLPVGFNEFHHLEGKEGALLYLTTNIRPGIRKFHTQYHHFNISQLLQTEWYVDFLKRIRYVYPQVIRIESRRFDKAGLDIKNYM